MSLDANHTDRQAIILRHHHIQQHKIILFDREVGKFSAYVRHHKQINQYQTLSAGTLISYRITSRSRNTHLVELGAIDDMPLRLAQKHMLFFHHLLEICYYFLSYESYDSQAIFDLLIFLYHPQNSSISVEQQKVIIFRLFAQLGIYPESITYHTAQFYQWVSCSLHELMEQKISREIEHLLDIWLINCINDHPMVASFKTIHFLDKVKLS